MSTSKRQVKCPACGVLNYKDQAVEHGKRYYCPPCLEQKRKPKPKERTDWDDLFDMITFVYGQKPTGMMYKQLKDYREKYQYTDAGMTYTLRYMYQVLNLNVKEEAGLGLILYYYDEAKRYYQELYHLQQVAEVFERNETRRVVQVHEVKPQSQVKRFQYDLIEWSEDHEE